MNGDADRPPGTTRQASNWARSVSRLNVSAVPDGALNLDVEGRRLASPIQPGEVALLNMALPGRMSCRPASWSSTPTRSRSR